VDSAILLIENIKNTLKNKEKDEFFKFVKAGFSQKRKTLLKNLTGLGIKRELLEEKFKELGIDPTIRAEKLSLQMWLSLIKSL
jgi:16S rRNA (adenine1518-N6/adenine1519-N6)-dimethyltransferase